MKKQRASRPTAGERGPGGRPGRGKGASRRARPPSEEANPRGAWCGDAAITLFKDLFAEIQPH